ncbi:MAG: response regulator transcription factor [Caldilineaceae bacterium]|nr:response regulator transcription factor [Caldilineaceae bacterium]
MEPVRVVAIADSVFVLEGITSLLGQSETCEVMSALLMTVGRWPLFYISPQVILIATTTTPSTTICRLIEEAKRRYPESAVLLVGVSQPAEVIAAYINAGLNGFVHHDLSPVQLTQAVLDVARYGLILDAMFVPKLQQMLQHDLDEAPLSSLTARELEIVRHAAKGRTNHEIAADLQVSVNTVKAHLRNAYEKLNVASRAELAVLALSAGMKLSEGRVAYLV